MEEKYILHYLRLNSGEPIARSGDAELVRYLDGHYELRGGTAEDQHALRAWCARHLPEALAPQPNKSIGKTIDPHHP